MRILKFIFGCRHARTSRVWARRVAVEVDGEVVGSKIEHYVICLECGAETAYRWNELGRIA